MSDLNETLDTVSQVLWRCFLLGVFFLFVWFAAFFWAGDLIYGQGAMFGLTPHECNLIHYGGMGLVKALVLVFFLFPYIAIRLILKKRRA